MDFLTDMSEKEVVTKTRIETITHEMISKAKTFKEKIGEAKATKQCKKKHRTMIDEKRGLNIGIVETFTVFPIGEIPDSFKEFTELAAKILKRRNTLEYDTFDQFVNDKSKLAVVEQVTIDGKKEFFCSCNTGMDGIVCKHACLLYLESGQITEPMMLSKAKKASKGRPKKVPKQQKKY